MRNYYYEYYFDYLHYNYFDQIKNIFNNLCYFKINFAGNYLHYTNFKIPQENFFMNFIFNFIDYYLYIITNLNFLLINLNLDQFNFQNPKLNYNKISIVKNNSLN